jgi:hypothetical protein
MTKGPISEPESYEPLYEAEEPLVKVPVKVDGPVEVRTLPAVAWAVGRFVCTDATGPIKASSRNPYRKVLRLSSETNPFCYGVTQEQVRTRETAAVITQDTVIELTHTEEVWINTAAAAETTPVTVVEEMWPS